VALQTQWQILWVDNHWEGKIARLARSGPVLRGEWLLLGDQESVGCNTETRVVVKAAPAAAFQADADGRGLPIWKRHQPWHGLRPLFSGLANLSGELRFRSGDQALTIDGVNPGSIPTRISQKTPISGFVASVACAL
jgi:hypothetical protein